MIFQWRINRRTTGASPGCRQPSHPIGIVSKNVEKKKLQPQLDLLTIRPRTRLPCFKHRSLEEQPEATATKNGVSQPAGYASSFAKDLVRTTKNGTTNVKPNPKFLKKKDQNLDPRTGKSQKSKTPENKQMLKIKGRKNPNPKET